MSDLDMCAMAPLNFRSAYLLAGLICPVKCDEDLLLLSANRDMRWLCYRVHAPLDFGCHPPLSSSCGYRPPLLQPISCQPPPAGIVWFPVKEGVGVYSHGMKTAGGDNQSRQGARWTREHHQRISRLALSRGRASSHSIGQTRPANR